MSQQADAQNVKTIAMFDRAIKETPKALRDAFNKVLTDLEKQATKRAPVRFGFLRASIQKLDIRVEDYGGRYRLVSGVAARQPYAFVQHENTFFNHPKGGEAKYISRPLQERAEMYRDQMAKAVMEALKGAAR